MQTVLTIGFDIAWNSANVDVEIAMRAKVST